MVNFNLIKNKFLLAAKSTISKKPKNFQKILILFLFLTSLKQNRTLEEKDLEQKNFFNFVYF